MALSSLPVSANSPPSSTQVFAPLPDWVIPVKSLPTPQKKGKHYDLQYLLVDNQLDLTGSQPALYKRYTSKIVSIKGLESASQIAIDFDPSYQTLMLHRLELVRDGKTIDKKSSATIEQFKREVDLDDLLYNGDQTLHIVLDNVKTSDIIDYSYSITGYNPVFGSEREWYVKTGWSATVALSQAKIRVPEHSPIRVSNLVGKGAFTQQTRQGIKEYLYRERNGLYDFNESEQPRWFNPYPYIHVSSFHNWKDVVDWALPLYRSQPEGKEIAKILGDIKAASPDNTAAQLVSAIHYVQDSIRYLGIENGIGSHQPRPPGQVIRQGYGDCKDKALLLVSLLENLGIKAWPALVDTYWREQLPKQPSAPYSFNHVIVKVDYDGKTYWIDATKTHQGNRLETLAQSRLGYGLVLASGKTEPEQIKGNVPAISREIDQRFVINHAEKESYLTVKTTYRGYQAEQWRRYLESKPLTDLGEEYANYYAGFFDRIDLFKPLGFSDDPDNNELVINEAYVIDDIWEKADDTYSFVISGDIVDDYLVKPELIRRKTPYSFGAEGGVRQKIRVSLPEDWQIEPASNQVDNPYFEFASSVKPVSGPGEDLLGKTYVEAQYYYRAKTRHVNAGELGKYMDQIEDARGSNEYEFSYQESE